MAASDPRTELAKQLSERTLPQYGIEAREIKLLADAAELVFEVMDREGGKYVLRLQDPDHLSDRAIRTQLAWLNSILDETDVLVPRPVPLSSNAPFGTMETGAPTKQYRFMLFDWVDGDRRKTPQKWVERDNLELVGRVVAQMHEHSQRYGVPKDSEVSSLDVASILGEDSVLRSHEVIAYLGDADLTTLYGQMDLIRAAVDECQTDDELGLIHADLGPHNWLFSEGQPSIIDFDAFVVGDFVHDLLGCLWSHSHWEENPTFVESLFAGYETIRSIGDNVKAHVYLLQAAHCLVWINWVLSLKSGQIQKELAPHIPHQVRVIDRLCGTHHL